MAQYACPNELILEEYLLGLKKSDKANLAEHVQNCSICRQIIRELILFYEILEQEFHRPIHNKVLDFALKLYQYQKTACIWVGMRKLNGFNNISPEYKVTFAYKLSSNGINKAFSDFNFKNLPKDTVILRTITDHKNCHTWMFLYGMNGARLTNCKILLQDRLVCETDTFGAGRLQIAMDELNNQVISLAISNPVEYGFAETEKFSNDLIC